MKTALTKYASRREASPSMSQDEFKRMLGQYAARAGHTGFCGRSADGQPLGPAVAKYMSELCASMDDTEAVKETAELMSRARAGDANARAQLCAIRTLTFNNYIYGSQNILSFFFDIVDLKDDESPYVKNETKQEIKVRYVGGDGQPNQTRIIPPHAEEKIPLRTLTTDEVEYFTKDIYNGRVAQSATATIDLGYNMRNQMDQVAFDLITATVANGGAFGPIVTSGARVNWPYVPSGRIKTANLPNTNDIFVPGTTNGTNFRYEVFKEIQNYGNKWGNMFPDGPLRPTGRVLVPSSDVADIADDIVPSGATRNKVADQLLETGWSVVDIHGIHYVLVADETLDRGTCYAEYNRKPGVFFTKNSQDEEWIDDSMEMKKKNKESRVMQKVVGAHVNSARRIFTARFKYRGTL